jgi:hypothetical protein
MLPIRALFPGNASWNISGTCGILNVDPGEKTVEPHEII